jgi:hypothetical protein
VQAAFLCDGGVDPTSRWIERTFQERTFAPWKPHYQIALLRLLPLLPPERASACADTVAQCFDEEGVGPSDYRRRLLKKLRGTIAWCAEVEQLPEDRQASEIVDGALAGRLVLRLARDPERRPLVVQEIRRRKITVWEISLLYLLDDLDVRLSARELNMLTFGHCDG